MAGGRARKPRIRYTYDSMNHRTGKTMEGSALSPTGSPVVESYQYDPTDQIANVDYGTGRTTGFQWDATGNRTSVADSAGLVPASYTANSLNHHRRLGSLGGDFTSVKPAGRDERERASQYSAVDAAAPTHDANGNLTGYAGQAFTYDSENRLLTATNGASAVTTTYDARRAVSRTVNGATTYYIWDGWNLIEERDGTGVELARYIHGPQIDEILVRIAATAPVYYHHDSLGSTVALTDATGTALETYGYDVFGRPEIRSAAGATLPVSAFQNRFLFTGREWIAEVELYDYRNRAYSAELGRFLQTDPIRFDAGDVNLYRYVANNPVNGRDPTGLVGKWYCRGLYYGCLAGAGFLGTTCPPAGIAAAVACTAAFDICMDNIDQ